MALQFKIDKSFHGYTSLYSLNRIYLARRMVYIFPKLKDKRRKLFSVSALQDKRLYRHFYISSGKFSPINEEFMENFYTFAPMPLTYDCQDLNKYWVIAYLFSKSKK